MYSFKKFWLFEEFSDEMWDNPALIFPASDSISYRQLDQMADRWRERVTQSARTSRPLVALDFVTSPEAIAAYIGVLRTGFPLLVVEKGQLNPNTALSNIWHPDIHIACSDTGLEIVQSEAGGVLGAGSAEEPAAELALLLSTSGSTGDPKLVRLSQENIASNAASIAEYLNIKVSDRAATTLPLHYSYGISVVNSYLLVGACLLVTERSVSEAQFWEDARQAHVTSLAMVPHQIELLNHMSPEVWKLPSLRYMTQAGGKLAPGLAKRFAEMATENKWLFFIMYGQTEAAPRISFVPAEDVATAFDTIGKAVPGGRLWLVDDSGKEITGTGVAGELVYQGPKVMMGYAQSRADLALGKECLELRTGDIAERTPGGYFRIVGRLKRFVKLYGLRLSLDQIEAVLSDKGVVANAVSVGDRLVLLHRDSSQGDEVVQIVCDAYALPQDALVAGPLEELPLLSSGKPDQRALRAIAEELIAKNDVERLSARSTESVADTLKRATRSRSVSASDSFTSLGGDSLSYIDVQMFLEERLGQAPQGWENMTVSQLSNLLAAPAAARSRGVVAIGSDIVLRLAAITMIVIGHASDYSIFYGGTWMLILLIGFSAAKFQMRQIEEGNYGKIILKTLYLIIPLYYILLICYGLMRENVPLDYILLVGNYRIWSYGTLLEPYWFVSLYVQIVVFLAIVSIIPSARHSIEKYPWASAAVLNLLLIVVMTVEYILKGEIGGVPYHVERGFAECLSIFAAGWMICKMRDEKTVFVTFILVCVDMVLLTGLGMQKFVAAKLAATVAILAFYPQFMAPLPLARMLSLLASTTLFVYIIHNPIVFFVSKLGMFEVLNVVIVIVLSFSLAVAMKYIFDMLTMLIMKRSLRYRSAF